MRGCPAPCLPDDRRPACPPLSHGNSEPDACLGTWQATGAAAISKLCHDSAADAGGLHRSVADSLKIAELRLHLAGQAPGEAGQLPPAEPAEGSPPARPGPPSSCDSRVGRSRGDSIKLPVQDTQLGRACGPWIHGWGTRVFAGPALVLNTQTERQTTFLCCVPNT